MLYAILLKHVFSLFSLDDAPLMESVSYTHLTLPTN